MGIFTVVQGKALLTTTAPSPAYGSGGKFYDTNGALYVVDSPTAVSFANGCAFAAGGGMLIYDASMGMPAGVVYQNGLPFYQNRLCVDVLNAPGYVSSAAPFAPGGSVSVSGSGLTTGGGLTTTFYAPLKTSLIPQTAAGSGVPTFTRATPAYVADCDGVLRQAVSGEARFSGARRVQNFASPPIMTWTISGNVALQPGVADPFGGTSAVTVTSTAFPNSFHALDLADIGVKPEMRIRNSMWIRRKAGVGAVLLNCGGSDQKTNVTASLTGSWQRLAADVSSNGAPGTYLGVELLVSGDAVDIAFPQSENVAGASNPAPSEYVSVGVLASPWHGAGVDGVRYFGTRNPNSVSGNVVSTDASGGTPIPAATLLGYLAEGQRTNLCLQSQTFDNAAWTASFVTTTADATAAPDGTMTADNVMETAINQEHQKYQGIAVTATAHTVSFYAKYCGRQWCFGRFDDGVTYCVCYFDIQNGVLGTVGPGATATITAFGNGWYRCTITRTTPATNWYVVLGTVYADNGAPGFPGDITKGVYLWGAQVEAAPFASSYIPTTTAAVTRNADVLTYPAAGNLAVLAPYSLYGEYKFNSIGPNTEWQVAFISDKSVAALLRLGVGPSTNIDFFSDVGVAAASIAVTDVAKLAGPKIAASMTGSRAQIAVNGAAGTSAVPGTQTLECTSFYVASNNNSVYQLYGTIRNVRIFGSALSDAKLIDMTT